MLPCLTLSRIIGGIQCFVVVKLMLSRCSHQVFKKHKFWNKNIILGNSPLKGTLKANVKLQNVFPWLFKV